MGINYGILKVGASIIGILLCITIIGLPLGIPILLLVAILDSNEKILEKLEKR